MLYRDEVWHGVEQEMQFGRRSRMDQPLNAAENFEEFGNIVL